ncbi:MAG: DEAD/DEAH box helicase family protein [Bacilli bacterium]|nr:DEAD/DEAH box helicase family protein [Bacilli bacterium]
MAVQVFKSIAINTSDNVKVSSKTKQFFLDEPNDTEQRLVVLYMYILPEFQQHGVKVGMTICRPDETFWHSIKSRIYNQKHELALSEDKYNRYGLKREVIYWGVCIDAHNESFKDYHVHDKITRLCAGIVEKEQEWFINVPAEELIEAFEKCRKVNVSKDIYDLRKEQKDCVDDLKKYFNKYPKGKRYLLNCKMRFGKSFVTYKYCEEANLNKILILTFIPAVETSWRDDLSHIKKEYKYFTDFNLKKPAFDLKSHNEPYVVFLSLQNYLGRDKNSAEVKAKIKKLQDIEFDLVVLDEYHFGAWNARTQDTFEDLDSAYQRNLKETKDVIKQFAIKTKKTICLSGTPFRALARGEFNKESTHTYSYFDEQRNKYPKSEEGNFDIIDPKYAMFPDMKIFGYNMTRLFSNLTASVFSDDRLLNKKYFSLNKFFRTKKDLNKNEDYVFIYEEEIKQWLEIIKGRSVYGDKFPYSNTLMLNNNKHTLWLMPSVNSCIAMARLLRNDEYFKKYQIINLSDRNVGSGTDAFEFLMDEMSAANNTGKLGSIAITVNKLTIGVTVKEWFSIFVLKDLSSPESYFQAIFRIQNPYVKGSEILKKAGYVYDFNMDRAAALILKYADESSRDGQYTKLDIAKLIVKYLPIFRNGDMTSPISESVFFELAELGDSSGVSLSKRIRDTSKTTRIMDDETIAAMLNDEECSEIIKHVFAHAKFSKPKTRTIPPAPENGFKTKFAKEGRDKGYELGMKDSEKYLDLDDLDVQKAFEENQGKLIDENCPSTYKDDERLWYCNGFIKGYRSGVNAPIKKLQCGKEDGIKFISEIKKRFGQNVRYFKSNRREIDNFVKKYLNNLQNIPKAYRGMLYKRWYCESFMRAIRNALTPVVDDKTKTSVEDADNVLQHILARLFEFLYISVYRETTFAEIFKNADPNTFLEAVGITKKDFEILNKYHIFQETTLNNYIHDFFVNESLGSELDLTNEKMRKQYRNSFNWFGFGVEN